MLSQQPKMLTSVSSVSSTYSRCKICSIILFLILHNQTVSIIHPEFEEASGILQPVRLFKEGCTGPMRKKGMGDRLSFQKSLCRRLKKHFAMIVVTLDTLQERFLWVSGSLLDQIVSERLGFKKLCAWWVLKMLSSAQFQKYVSAACEFFDRFQSEVNSFSAQCGWVYIHESKDSFYSALYTFFLLQKIQISISI